MPEGFDAFVAERLDRLLRYATALTCDPHLAEDIVQEVLVRVHRKWARIEAAEAPARYVTRMVTNEYLSWRRRRASREVRSEPSAFAHITQPGDHAHEHAERDAMLARIAALPRKQRAAIVLRYYEGCGDAEIAALLGCGESTVRSHISRALATLRAGQPHLLKEPSR